MQIQPDERLLLGQSLSAASQGSSLKGPTQKRGLRSLSSRSGLCWWREDLPSSQAAVEAQLIVPCCSCGEVAVWGSLREGANTELPALSDFCSLQGRGSSNPLESDLRAVAESWAVLIFSSVASEDLGAASGGLTQLGLGMQLCSPTPG